MQRKTLLIVAGATLAVVGLLAWAFAPRAIEVEVATATQGAFEATVDEDAKTRLRDRYVVSAPLSGTLGRIALREGDAVEAGAVVAMLTPVLSPLQDERTRRELQARVGAADAQLQRAEALIEVAQLALRQARSEVERSEALARQGYISPNKLEIDRIAAESARASAEAAVEARHMARHDAEQARAALAATSPAAGGSTAGRAFALRAPSSGRVLRVVQTSEAAVAAGTPLLELGDTGRLEVVSELLTTDALRVPPGARVVIERWGGDGVLAGRVRQIEPAAFTKVSALGVEEQRVRVLIDLNAAQGTAAALGDGYRVGVRIVTLAADPVLSVPVSAVFPLPGREGEPKAGMAVFQVAEGRARLTPVTVGARNGSRAWIQKGLEAGATVIVYPPATVADGVRVKPRRV